MFQIRSDVNLTDINPSLWLFRRNDMPLSMNSGRTAAQMSHATSVFHKRMDALKPNPLDEGESAILVDWLVRLYDRWYNQTPYGYGTVIVKDMDLNDMYAWEAVAKTQNFFGEVVIDPEYKFKDGDHVFTSNDVPTGLILFGVELSTSFNSLRQYPYYGSVK